MGSKLNSKLYVAGSLALAAVAFLAVNIYGNASFTGARLDLTEHRLFTLSEGTLRTLQALDEPVTLRLYLSQKLATRLPSIASYAARVRELLDEYALASQGKLIVTNIDPEPFSEAEDRAVSYGLQGIPVGDGESAFYFGLVGTNTLDDVEAIPYLAPEREEFVEYDVTKMVHGLGNPKRKVVGLLTTLPMDGITQRSAMTGQPPQPWIILEQMQGLFEVRRLPSSVSRIDADIDVLMVVHPKRSSPETEYAIDQFVLGGGRALVFVDSNAEADQSQGIPGMPPLPQASEFARLLGAWGLALDTTGSVGDLQLAVKVRHQQGERVITAEYPPWMNVPPELMDADDIVTGKLGNLTFGSPGALEVVADAGTTVTPLVRTTEGAMVIKNEVIGPMADVQHLLRVYKPGGRSLVLAARVQGRARSAFPDGRPPPSEDTKEPSGDDAAKPAEPAPKHLAEGDLNLIVVADVDLLQDQFWVQAQNFLGNRIAVPIAANGAFVTNALDNLMGSADLINVRSRGRSQRPFSRVNAMREEAEVRFREKEVQLLERLEATEKRLDELESTKQEGALVLSDAQRVEIDKFRDEKVRIRKELREVRRDLRRNIESLEGTLKFVNIGLVPVLIGVGGVGLGLHRVRRRKRARAPAAGGA